MAGSLKQSHTQLTETLIKKAFIRLFSKDGLDKITVSGICSESGISRSTFYQHFDDKYTVLQSIEDMLLEDVKKINQDRNGFSMNPFHTALPGFIDTAQYIADHREYFLPLICSPGEPIFLHRWTLLMQEDFLRQLETDHVLPEENAEITVYSIASAIIGMYEYWLTKEPKLTAEQLAQIGTRVLWSSFYNKK